MANNRLGEAASFEMPSLAGLLPSASDRAGGTVGTPDAPPCGHQPTVMFPLLQVLRLQDNSIRSIQGLQLFGFTGLHLASIALRLTHATAGLKYLC